MSLAQDPFYIVKEEVQESIDKLKSTFHQWEHLASGGFERVQLSKELTTGCESIEWQVDELDKAIAVAERDPSRYGIDNIELQKRKQWTNNAHNQVAMIKKAVAAGKRRSPAEPNLNGMRQELLQLSNDHRADHEEYISSETDRQMLLIKQQDMELDELSESVVRIGGVSLTIHDELVGQGKILDELNTDMDRTTNRLDFVQKKVALVMKKAGAKGQIMMIIFLIALFITLFVLVFFT